MSLTIRFQGDACSCVRPPERATATALVPVDDGEVLLQSERRSKRRTSLIIGRPGPCWTSNSTGLEASVPADANPLGGVSELYAFERVGLHFLLQTWMRWMCGRWLRAI